MTDPITPPPELVGEWLCSEDYPWGPLEQASVTITTNRLQNVATQAARWGADQELEACLGWLAQKGYIVPCRLRTARRPKPPSLKEQALALTTAILDDPNRGLSIEVRDALALNRRALEELNIQRNAKA